MEKRRILLIILVIVFLVALGVLLTLLIFYQTNPSAETKIKEKLLNYEIPYTGIGGNDLSYKIKVEDIKEISKTSLNGEEVLKVKIGEGLSWNIYFDKEGNQIIKTEQLFVT